MSAVFLYLKSVMKKIILFVGTVAYITFSVSCSNAKKTVETNDISAEEKAVFKQSEGDTIHIANKAVEYEIIIIEPGFNTWLQSIARPQGFYSQTFLENRNILMVNTWNNRVLHPAQFNPNLYELQIDYRQGIDYGYEVNYQLYNYFIYFQRKYRQRLGPFYPRI